MHPLFIPSTTFSQPLLTSSLRSSSYCLKHSPLCPASHFLTPPRACRNKPPSSSFIIHNYHQKHHQKHFIMSINTEIPSFNHLGPNDIKEFIAETNRRAASNEPFTPREIHGVITSLKLTLGAARAPLDQKAPWEEPLEHILREYAHRSHKNWTVTEEAASKLTQIIGTSDREDFRTMFQRVLVDGGWDVAYRASKTNRKPWIVLVSGLNGIRKTTAVYQPWFNHLLHEVLSNTLQPNQSVIDLDRNLLPSGLNTFFRQLDYMIATIVNVEFARLYSIAGDIRLYSAYKQAIFARYRMVAEMLGVVLLKDAKQKKMNIMIETSGRDIGMFTYIDHFFTDTDSYNKLVVNFQINDISFAEASVDNRMVKEMQDGAKTIAVSPPVVLDIIKANAGGPYGSEILEGVLEDSQRVWKTIVDGSANVGHSWYKASIQINASDTSPWSACGNYEKAQKSLYHFNSER